MDQDTFCYIYSRKHKQIVSRQNNHVECFLKLTELISPPPEIKNSKYVDFAGRLYVPQISMSIEIARN